MEHFVSLEIWAVLAAAPCTISWYLGEMRGAARVRKMIVAEEASIAPRRLHDGSSIPGNARFEEHLTGQEPAAVFVAPSTSVVPIQPEKHEAVQSRRRKEAFDDMPSVAYLHAQAQLIRENGVVWDDPEMADGLRKTDPISARVLQHYRGSINELARCNARLDADGFESSASLEYATDDLPNFADAAPLSPDSLATKNSRASRPATETVVA
ncbi:MAG: hypothetical protein AAGK01_03765 [Pseudomonadota bacterium]